MNNTQTRCCISGGGPAGIMLGYLLARAGIDTVVLEKWGDFLRDFRGDTIHPSTMEVLDELGLLDDFLALNPDKTPKVKAYLGGTEITMANFTHLRVKCPYIAFIPQSDFLNFLSAKAKQYSTFRLMTNTEVTGLIEDSGTIKGVLAKSGNETIKIEAELTIGADGRHSTIRDKAKLNVIDYGAPVDVLWFRISRNAEENLGSAFYIDKGSVSITLNRGSYWQCGYIIKKDSLEEIKQHGLDAFRKKLAELIPHVAGNVHEIKDWDSVKLLSVAVNHLEQWYKPGLICIGDAAHAMSPVGGVGINLAIQDAVASANILIPAFKSGKVTEEHLSAIQQRRSPPARTIQKVQVFMHKNLIARALNSKEKFKVPFVFGLVQKLPFINRIPGRLVGLGPKPEHIEVKL